MLTKKFYRLCRLTAIAILVLQFCACKTQNLFQAATARINPSANASIDSAFFSISPDYQYRIRNNDKISISVWDHDELSVGSLYGIYNSNEVYGKWLMVNARGDINMPRIGPFHVAGHTIVQVEDSLRQRLATWIKNPIVDIKVLNKEVTIMGELKSPGRFLLERDNNTLMELLAKAGDFDFYANKKQVKVIRTVDDLPHQITIDLTKMDNYAMRNIRILPGDLIYVPAKKGKDFDKRISTIIPFASIVTAFAIGYGTFF